MSPAFFLRLCSPIMFGMAMTQMQPWLRVCYLLVFMGIYWGCRRYTRQLVQRLIAERQPARIRDYLWGALLFSLGLHLLGFGVLTTIYVEYPFSFVVFYDFGPALRLISILIFIFAGALSYLLCTIRPPNGDADGGGYDDPTHLPDDPTGLALNYKGFCLSG